MVTNVLEKFTALIFRLSSEDGSSRFLRNVDTYLWSKIPKDRSLELHAAYGSESLAISCSYAVISLHFQIKYFAKVNFSIGLQALYICMKIN
jgi:hypothetical protein